MRKRDVLSGWELLDNEPPISFQTWICPICFDDHLKENKDKCIKNLKSDNDALKKRIDGFEKTIRILCEELGEDPLEYCDVENKK